MPSRSSAPVAGRMRSAQPPASSWNIVTTITRSACSASARTLGSAAASSPETTSRLIVSGLVSSASAATDQAAATPRPFGVTGRWNAPQPGLPSKPSSCASSAIRAPPPPPGPGPDEHRALGGAQPLPELAPGLREVSRQNAAAPPGAICSVAGRRADDDLGSAAPRLLDPEVDDRRALDDRVVADDDDELRVRDRGEREPERVERVRGRLREDRRVRADPARSSRPSAYAISFVSEPESAVTIAPSASRSISSAASSASSQDTSVEALRPAPERRR